MKELVAKIRAFVGIDGILHTSVSALLMFALGWIRPMWIPCCIVLAIGVAKEIADRFLPNHSAQWKDLLFDAIGIGVGCALVVLNCAVR